MIVMLLYFVTGTGFCILGSPKWKRSKIGVSSIHFDRNLNCELWLGMLFVDLLETTLNP